MKPYYLALMIRLLGLAALAMMLQACASSPAVHNADPARPPVAFNHVLNYATSLPDSHKDSLENVFSLPRSKVEAFLADYQNRPSAESLGRLSEWLINDQGYGMLYDVSANYTPAQALEKRVGNCLSFTLLLIELAEELGITVHPNQVDVPEVWEEDQANDLIFYRHVNAVLRSGLRRHVFDLAIEDYDFSYPQRHITKQQAAALLFSNLGIDHLQNQAFDEAEHYLKLAVAHFPENADMWINLAAFYKQTQQLAFAEKAYLHAFQLNDANGLAASNLERLYILRGNKHLAARFAKYAAKARLKNPYHQFRSAQQAYEIKHYRKARKAIERAIAAHAKDPRFFELRSRLKQVQGRYVSAAKDLETAHNLSQDLAERGRYATKVELILAHVKALAEKKQRRSYRLLNESRNF